MLPKYLTFLSNSKFLITQDKDPPFQTIQRTNFFLSNSKPKMPNSWFFCPPQTFSPPHFPWVHGSTRLHQWGSICHPWQQKVEEWHFPLLVPDTPPWWGVWEGYCLFPGQVVHHCCQNYLLLAFPGLQGREKEAYDHCAGEEVSVTGAVVASPCPLGQGVWETQERQRLSTPQSAAPKIVVT